VTAAGRTRPGIGDEPTVEALGPDWAAIRAYSALAVLFMAAVITARIVGGPRAAIGGGLLVLAAVFLAAHVRYALTRRRPKPMPRTATYRPVVAQPAGSARVTVTVTPGHAAARATVEVAGGTRIQQLAAGIGLAGVAASVISAHLAAAVRALSATGGTVPVSSGRVIAGEIADRPAGQEVPR
jgi:hypothetical protein